MQLSTYKSLSEGISYRNQRRCRFMKIPAVEWDFWIRTQVKNASFAKLTWPQHQSLRGRKKGNVKIQEGATKNA